MRTKPPVSLPTERILSDRGLFLDLDGTLADTLPVMRAAFEAFMGRFDLVATQEEFDSFNGPPLREIVRTLAARYEIGLPHDALLSIYNGIIDEAYMDARPFPGAKAFLENARVRGFRTAIVTSSSRTRTSVWLGRHELSGFVDLIVASEDVTKGKPDPEPYALALSRSLCAQSRSLAVEDSLKGARSALDAGLAVWLVAHDGSAPDAPLPEGLRLAGSFSEILLGP